jgi:CubicO group peptidase (beta-lactamase class C family)
MTALIFCAAAARADEIDRYVKAEMQRQKIPGVSLAVLRNGKIQSLKSYGQANVEHRVPVRPETVFQSGSIAKQFTAAAVMILVEEGKISLDDKIIKPARNGNTAILGMSRSARSSAK